MKGIVLQTAGVILSLVSLIIIKMLGLPALITALLVVVAFGALIYGLAGSSTKSESAEDLSS